MTNEHLAIYEDDMPKRRAVRFLVACAQETISERYGPRSENPKPYHSLNHTNLVIDSARSLANKAHERMLIKPNDKRLLVIAAAYHDIVHNGGDSEAESAEEAAQAMRNAGVFSEEEVQTVKEMILATRIQPSEGTIIVQSPQPGNTLQMLIADADLSSFGLPWEEYLKTAMLYFYETNPGKSLDGDQLVEFFKRQKRVLENHSFFTPEAEQVFSSKGHNIDTITRFLADPAISL